MSSEKYERHLAAAVSAAQTASDVLSNRFNAGVRTLESWQKSPGALVTEADIESDRAIAEVLLESGCGGEIVSEESNLDLGSESLNGGLGKIEWLIDPLCGTVPFSTGMNHWGVNIAMRADGQLILSALAAPMSEGLLTASIDRGVEINGVPLRGEFPDRMLDEVAVGLEIDGQDQWRMLLATRGLNWVTRVGQVNSFSSAAYPLMLVCTGRMSGVVFYRIEPMHVAAGALAAKLLGAEVSDGFGRQIDWSSDDELSMVVVAWPQIHSQLIDAINNSD